MDWPRQPKSSYLWDQVPASTMLPLRSYLGRRRSLSRSFSLSLHLPLCHSFLLYLRPGSLFFSSPRVSPSSFFSTSCCYTSGFLCFSPPLSLTFLPLDTRCHALSSLSPSPSPSFSLSFSLYLYLSVFLFFSAPL